MYKISVNTTFSAAHFLEGYNGNCSRLHGHNWKVEAVFVASELVDGMIIDFRECKKILQKAIEQLDHKNINDVLKCRTTAENIAKWIFDTIDDPRLYQVKVWETSGSMASYVLEDRGC